MTVTVHRNTVAARAGKGIRVVLNPTIWIPATISRTVYIVGVGCWIVSDRNYRNVGQVVVLGEMAAIITCIILGNVIGHGG